MVIINRYLLRLCLYMKLSILLIKEKKKKTMGQDSNYGFKYIIEFKIN